MLGSVGQYCVHHAQCPVLIIRDAPSQAVHAA
jgi:nucleotide-binding universal stress UspA family protein